MLTSNILQCKDIENNRDFQMFLDIFFNFVCFSCAFSQFLLILHPKLYKMENILSQNVRRICRERKLTLKELARQMGVDPAALNRALGGNCRYDTMQKMANALGVSLKSLFEPMEDVEGFIRVDGKVYQFNSKEELNSILQDEKRVS